MIIAFYLLLLAVPIAAFSVFRLFRRTGHQRDVVFVTGAIFLISAINSLVIMGQVIYGRLTHPLGLSPVGMTSIWLLIGCGVLVTLMALTLSLKHWPYRNLDSLAPNGMKDEEQR